MPPSNNVITSFLSTLIGQPHFGAEGPRNASIVTRRTFPYVGGAAGHETTLGHTALACSAYRKLVLAVALVTSFCVTTFLAARKVVPDVFPHIIRLVHETKRRG